MHALVVLGAPVTADRRPGPHLRARLDAALALLAPRRDGDLGAPLGFLPPSFDVVVVTGGAPKTYGSAGVVPEATVMCEYLVERGVPMSRCVAVCVWSSRVWSSG